ncbi:MAG: hypothetical protein Ta2B_30620 [Termitinemataceae bacterium]|nr:MAG: hypothetical protein Ta2B_30620 [Termitinemataceae bacterium]
MSVWNVIDRMIMSFPNVALTLILIAVVAAITMFLIGFSRRGINFIKYGFGRTTLDTSIEKRFDQLDLKFEANEKRFDQLDLKFEANEKRFDQLDLKFEANEKRFDRLDSKIEAIETKIETIETNHFGHLKNYLEILNGVLLDKRVIDNETKARMDNELRGM